MKKSSGGDAKFSCGCLLLVIALGVAGGLVRNAHRETITAKVVDKAIKRSDRDHDKYLIYTDHETLEDEDSLLNGKFNSSDVYGQITAGHTYRFEVIGWRNPFFSIYRNIISVQEVAN